MEVKNCAYCGKKLDETIFINNIVFCSAECSDDSNSCDYLGILERKAAAFDALEVAWKDRTGMKMWVAVACGDKSKSLLSVVEETGAEMTRREEE